MNQQNYNADTGAGYRVASLLAVILAALAIAVIPFQAVMVASKTVESSTLLNLLKAAIDSGNSIFGALPSFFLPGVLGTVYNLSIYVFLACLVGTAIFGLVGLLSGKGSLARTAVCLLAIGAAVYTISLNLILTNDAKSINLDFISLGLALGGAFIYVLTSTPQAGKISWLHFVQFILSVSLIEV